MSLKQTKVLSDLMTNRLENQPPQLLLFMLFKLQVFQSLMNRQNT